MSWSPAWFIVGVDGDGGPAPRLTCPASRVAWPGRASPRRPPHGWDSNNDPLSCFSVISLDYCVCCFQRFFLFLFALLSLVQCSFSGNPTLLRSNKLKRKSGYVQKTGVDYILWILQFSHGFTLLRWFKFFFRGIFLVFLLVFVFHPEVRLFKNEIPLFYQVLS